MEYLPEAFACVLFNIGCDSAGGLWWIIGAPRETFAGAGIKDFVLQNHKMFFYYGCLCVIQESFQREGL